MPIWADKELSGWGRVLRARSAAARPERMRDLEAAFASARGDSQIARGDSQSTRGDLLIARDDSLLAHGAGRSYGDAALNSGGRSVLMSRLDRFLAFDPESGMLVAEAGASFAQVLETFLPHGFAPPVVPGTGFATLGGGVANDVHGKNHHQAGSLGQHIEWLDLRLPSGDVCRVEPARDEALFKATLGGIGLTGAIERICLRLERVPSNAVTVRKRRIADLDEFLAAFAEERERSRYVVGWIDALAKGAATGRGILESASPAAEGVPSAPRKARRVPLDFPAFALNSLSVRMFNQAYWSRVPPGGVERRSAYGEFLFPLDALHDWNRIYGKRGFHQFQCVVPFEEGAAVLARMLETIAKSGRASFLAVLKAMGPAGLGYLSFPRPGYTLALDFPNAPGASELIAQLERLTCDHGGRTYLAKDSTLSAENLRRMYPDLKRFQDVLAQIDPHSQMQSDMSRRLRLRERLP
jgi:decaprenylphospho-beta-D-ribofuranose 2-oxidase